MKLFTALAATAVIGSSFIAPNPIEARTPSVHSLAGSFAGGHCLYETGFYEKDSVMARVIETGKEQGQTPEEVMKMVNSPGFFELVASLINQEGGCIEMSNLQFRVWGMPQRATRIVNPSK